MPSKWRSLEYAYLTFLFFYLGVINTIVYVITHVFQGVLTDVRTFLKEEEADKYQEKLWKDNGIPVNEAEREKYYEENEVDDDIQKWKTEAQ